MSEMLEEIVGATNIMKAYRSVVANHGSGGVDGVTTEELLEYLRENYPRMKREILSRTYRPQPVLRVEIPKPNGGVRKLGIPTVADRVVQQATVQVLGPIFEPTFCEFSYGFRPKRSAQQAVLKLAEYINAGYEWIVDLDLEKFFDNVPQDKLMSYVGRIIHDGDTESLIRKYLQAGVMIGGSFEETEMGVPQGGPLSPLLSNIMLNELDKELLKRGLHFVRYADDCVIAVGSEASAKRVMDSITRFIEHKLSLKVNATKSKVCRPTKLKYLGFTFYRDSQTKEWRPTPHKDSVEKFKAKLKELCCRSWSVSMDYRISRLNPIIRGWVNYFKIGDMKKRLVGIDEHLRNMLRVVVWKQWKVPSKRYKALRMLGVDENLAKRTSYAGNRFQYVALKTCLRYAVSKDILKKKGLISILDYYLVKRPCLTFKLS